MRGGIPVIFPQFAERGPGVRHGFARTREWRLVEVVSGADRAYAVLQLDSSEETRVLWPHDFELKLRVQIEGTELLLALSCRNRGGEAFEFTAALHTYLAILNLERARVLGLEGLGYCDSARMADGQTHEEPLVITGEVDRIYGLVRRPLELSDGKDAHPARRLRIDQSGFEDAVIWNPGSEKCAALSDMPPGGFLNMLCIEAAQVGRPVHLGPGEEWQGRQVLRVEAG